MGMYEQSPEYQEIRRKQEEADLTEAVLRADDAAARHLSVVVWALRSAMPAAAWGSFDRVATWAAHRGLSGLQGAAQGLGQGNPDP